MLRPCAAWSPRWRNTAKATAPSASPTTCSISSKTTWKSRQQARRSSRELWCTDIAVGIEPQTLKQVCGLRFHRSCALLLGLFLRVVPSVLVFFFVAARRIVGWVDKFSDGVRVYLTSTPGVVLLAFIVCVSAFFRHMVIPP